MLLHEKEIIKYLNENELDNIYKIMNNPINNNIIHIKLKNIIFKKFIII